MKKKLLLLHLLAVTFFANAQNVGIGTTTPLQKLHVEGTTFLNGNVGIGASTPAFPLSFSPAMGNKISLWSDGTATHYGLGIQSGLLQVFTKTVNDDIAFGYGSSSSFTERMRIKGNGNVGIGTSTPTSMLDVNGQITIDQKNFGGWGGLLIKGNAPGSAYPNIGFSIKNNAATPQDIISAVMLGTINNNIAGAESMDLSFMTSTSGQAGLTERLLIKDNGNIGIGTNSPNVPLGFPATLEKKITLYPGSTGDAGFGVFGNELRIASDYSGADITFGYDNRTSGFTETMRIKGNGNVGIGTTNPQTNLSVQNGMNIDQADGNIGSVVNALTFGNNSGEGIGSKRNAGGNQWGLDFYTGAANRMSITNGGNVGIGTISPVAKLHVSAGEASVALFGPNAYGGMLYIGASATNYSAALTAQVLVSDGNLHIDPALNKNIYIGYYQPRNIYLNPGGVGKVGIGTTTPAASLEVNGYTKLGSDAPSIKFKKLTGTTAATGGGFVYIPHGLDNSKILSVAVMVQINNGTYWGPNVAGTGDNFYWYITINGNIAIGIVYGDSGYIQSVPIKILITYEE